MELPEYNPDKAKKLLAEAGHPNGFTIKDYFISKSFFYPKMLTLVQEQLKKVGINVEVQLVEHATYHENIRKNRHCSRDPGFDMDMASDHFYTTGSNHF